MKATPNQRSEQDELAREYKASMGDPARRAMLRNKVYRKLFEAAVLGDERSKHSFMEKIFRSEWARLAAPEKDKLARLHGGPTDVAREGQQRLVAANLGTKRKATLISAWMPEKTASLETFLHACARRLLKDMYGRRKQRVEHLAEARIDGESDDTPQVDATDAVAVEEWRQRSHHDELAQTVQDVVARLDADESVVYDAWLEKLKAEEDGVKLSDDASAKKCGIVRNTYLKRLANIQAKLAKAFTGP